MTEIRLSIAATIENRDGSVHQVGDTRTLEILTGLTGDVSDVSHVVAASTTATLYDADELSLGAVAWAFAWLSCDSADVFAELTTDKDGSAGAKELYTIKLGKNIPTLLGSRASYSGYVENFGGGTVDTIDRIRVRNTGTAAATVRLVLVR